MRPPGYKKRTIDVLNALERICGMGHTLSEAAEFAGVSLRQLERWRKQSPAVDDAIRKGRARAHVTVTKALFDAATGRAVKEERTEPVLVQGRPVLDPVTNQPLTRTVKEYYPPNLGAQVFFLCNRFPDRWRNVQRVEVSQVEAVSDLVFVVEEQESLRVTDSGELREVPPQAVAYQIDTGKEDTG